MESNINFICPNFLSYGRNEILINLYKKHKDLLIDDSCIYSFYGDFHKTLFNGGRCVDQYNENTIKEMKKVKKFYNSNGIRITLTFTNQCLEERHLDDKYCNNILKVFHDGFNEVLIASPILEEYIRKKYPKFKINKSITYAYLDGKPYELNKKYNISVLDKRKNNDFDFINKIPLEDRKHIELLCDELCTERCSKQNQHYRELSLTQLGLNKEDDPNFGQCKYMGEIPDWKLIYTRNYNNKYYISTDDIENKYVPLGFKYFKLSGRNKFNMEGFENITSYLIKKEYQDDIKTYILERMLLEMEEDSKKDGFYY